MNDQFYAARQAAGLSRKQLAEQVHAWILTNHKRDRPIDEHHVGKIERGEIHWPNTDYRAAFRSVLGVESDIDLGFRRALEVTDLELDQLLDPEALSDWTTVQPPDLDGLEALELVRRIEASDTGPATMEGLQDGTDRLCRSYTSTMPAELLVPLSAYRSYATGLLDGRATLAQRRELMVIAGWLSLLTAICRIDLGHHRAAATNLYAAHTLAREAGHSLLSAWAWETEAWEAITRGNAQAAVPLCEASIGISTPDTSVFVQVTMQQARASALLHLVTETRRLLDQTADALDRMPRPEHPEHHFVFDGRKLVSYTATALAWLGDESELAEDYARRAVRQYDVGDSDGRWRSRLASARLDLALILARAGEPGEAGHLGELAIASGYLRPSNRWRAQDLDRLLADRYPRLAEARDYHERLLELPAGD